MGFLVVKSGNRGLIGAEEGYARLARHGHPGGAGRKDGRTLSASLPGCVGGRRVLDGISDIYLTQL